MEVAPDVPLYDGEGFLTGGWEVSIGLVRPRPDEAQEYFPEAWLPGTFHVPTPDERQRYTSADVPADRAFVAILPLEIGAASALRDYHDAARRGIADDRAGILALKQVLIAAAARLVIEGGVETQQPSIDAPRQRTVSRDYEQTRARRVGLHRDGWTTEHGDRDAPNRFAMNLGPGTRWLLYVPYSVARLRACADASDGTPLLERFAESLPVLRVPVPPMHAYVAPTETVFHDASTVDSQEPSLKQLLLGRFRVRGSR